MRLPTDEEIMAAIIGFPPPATPPIDPNKNDEKELEDEN